MKSEVIRQKLHDYINSADDDQIECFYAMVEGEMGNAESRWDDVGFVAEIEKRTNEMEEGKVKTFTWDEVRERAKKSLQEAQMSK